MTYLPRAIYLDADDMAKFILATPATGWTWRPVGITWHNTGAPNITQWDDYPQGVKDAWGDNLDHYYKFNEGWHAGPHACGTPDKGIILGEFRANGVHASCFNSDHFGIETVGDFRTGGDDPLTGRGLASMQSSANIVAALCKRMGWTPRKVINFHRECPRDGHPCPGNLVTDAWAIGLVETRMAELGSPVAPAPATAQPLPDLSTTKGVQQALVGLGARIDIDGSYGPQTRIAVADFQRQAGIIVDGAVGPDTRAALAKELATL